MTSFTVFYSEYDNVIYYQLRIHPDIAYEIEDTSVYESDYLPQSPRQMILHDYTSFYKHIQDVYQNNLNVVNEYNLLKNIIEQYKCQYITLDDMNDKYNINDMTTSLINLTHIMRLLNIPKLQSYDFAQIVDTQKNLEIVINKCKDLIDDVRSDLDKLL